MLVETVVLPSSVSDEGGADAALSLFLDIRSGGQLITDSSGLGMDELARSVLRWKDPHRRDRASRALLRLQGAGRAVALPPGPPATGCTPACNALRSVAARWEPGILVCGHGCQPEVPATATDIATYIGSETQERLRRETITLSRRTATEEDLRDRFFAPFVRYAGSLVVHDRQIGRSVQDGWVGGRQASVPQGFDATIRLLLATYAQSGRVKAPSVRIVTGVFGDRDGSEAAVAELALWARDLARDAGRVAVTIDIREERRNAQLNHDRYLISNQAAVMVSRGFDLLMTDPQMRDRGLVARRDPRPVHTVNLTRLGNADEALLEAEDLERYEAG